jgi:hypothetical protein
MTGIAHTLPNCICELNMPGEQRSCCFACGKYAAIGVGDAHNKTKVATNCRQELDIRRGNMDLGSQFCCLDELLHSECNVRGDSRTAENSSQTGRPGKEGSKASARGRVCSN